VRSGILRLAAFFVTLVCPATAQVAILQIKFLEGEGAVHSPGARIARALTVEVTDETGKPVAGAAVSFHLPVDGPSGVLGNGLRTDVGVTDGQGRASLRGLQVSRTPGRYQIRVVASKEQARAGAMASQYVAELRSPLAESAATKRRTKWVVVAALVGGGAAAGILSAGRASASSPGSTALAPPPVAGGVTLPPVSIGSPATSVGRP
jgi:hypothetical protein